MYYTKYRPQKFSEVSKPNDVAEAIAKQVTNKKTVHAYLFVGPRGTGKTTIARILAKALNCTNLADNGDPCDECDRCLAIKNGSYLDLIEIDAASNRGIDDIRAIREKINLSPSIGDKKMYIIDEVHMLTPEAFNALLKTLEEPPKHAVFVLCTTEAHKVPETIRSRCQVFNIKRATISQIVKKLEEIAKQEGHKINKQELRIIASTAQGGFRDAETLLQQVIEGELSVDALTSIGTREVFADFFEALVKSDAREALRVVNKMYENGIDLYVWTGELLKYLREVLLVKANAYEDLLDTTSEVLEKMHAQAVEITHERFLYILETLITAQGEIKGSFITQLPLEIAITKICDQGDGKFEINSTDKLSPQSDDDRTDNNTSDGNVAFSKKNVPDKKEAGKKGIDKKEVKNSKTIDMDEIKEKTTETEITTEQDLSEDKKDIQIEMVVSNWKTIIKEVNSVNHGVSALLKSVKIQQVEGKTVVFGVPFDFHKERLESLKNRKIVEDVLSSVLETEIMISCDVIKHDRKVLGDKETGKLTDYNIMVPSGAASQEVPEDILDSLDGGLPFI